MAGVPEAKCVVWDLDRTVWDGVLLEDPQVTLRPGLFETVRTLDERGILQSVASRNHPADALAKLASFGLDSYFLYPEVGWGAKSEMVSRIRANLELAIDSFVFIDDDPYERAEVQSEHPGLEALDAGQFAGDFSRLLLLPRLCPRFVTQDSARRRQMYRDDQRRRDEEQAFTGPKEAFLAGLGMRLSIAPARQEDLERAEELTVRTHQLNATGRTYSYDELEGLRASSRHRLYICELVDRLGSYGKVGLALLEAGEQTWHLRLMLVSCRVMSRGVGTVLLGQLQAEARRRGARLLADFVPTERNRMMYVAYKFAGFAEVGQGEDGAVVLEADLSQIPPPPPHVEVSFSAD